MLYIWEARVNLWRFSKSEWKAGGASWCRNDRAQIHFYATNTCIIPRYISEGFEQHYLCFRRLPEGFEQPYLCFRRLRNKSMLNRLSCVCGTCCWSFSLSWTKRKTNYVTYCLVKNSMNMDNLIMPWFEESHTFIVLDSIYCLFCPKTIWYIYIYIVLIRNLLIFKSYEMRLNESCLLVSSSFTFRRSKL